MTEQRAAGTATLVISEYLYEVLALSDRIAVMFEGHYTSREGSISGLI